MTRVQTVLARLGAAVLLERCIVCGRFGAALHTACVDALPAAAGPRCAVCWAPLAPAVAGVLGAASICARCAAAPPPFVALRAPFRFEGAARRAVLEAKFRGVSALLPPLAGAAAALVPAAWAVEAIVPVPLHPPRERRRGFNQSLVAARAAGAVLGLPVWAALRRTRATPPQAGLDAAMRAQNLRGAFAAAGVPPGRVLLIDDVTTTGATLAEGARALRAAGAEAVYAMALARED